MKATRTFNLNVPGTYSQYSQTIELEHEDPDKLDKMMEEQTKKCFKSYKEHSAQINLLVSEQDTQVAEQLKKLQTEVSNLNKEIELRSMFRKFMDETLGKDKMKELTEAFKESPEYKKLTGVIDNK